MAQRSAPCAAAQAAAVCVEDSERDELVMRLLDCPEEHPKRDYVDTDVAVLVSLRRVSATMLVQCWSAS